VPLSRAQRQRLVEIARGRSDEPLRLLEGRKAVLDALALGVVAEVWAGPGLVAEERGGLADAANRAGLALGEADGTDVERVSETQSPQGVLALVRDTAEPLERLAARRGLLVWLDGVQDPGNVGAVVRAAAAFGVAGLIAGAGTADPLGTKALRASAGLALKVPFARAAAGAVAPALAKAKREAWLLERDGRDVFAVADVPPTLVLVLGSEGAGPGAEARGAARATVGIPIQAGVESLNAAVAMGIALAVFSRRLSRTS
jgi:tRNA G18 (ribose-2'-O)-methylase SpoU